MFVVFRYDNHRPALYGSDDAELKNTSTSYEFRTIVSRAFQYNARMEPHPSTYEYFLGLSLPEPENTFFASLKQEFQNGKPLSSPPHVTLMPPFEFPNFQRLDGLVARFARHQKPFTSTLDLVGTFRQKRHGTVFLAPKKGEPFKTLVNGLNDFLIELEPVENFHPHLTVGHRVPLEELETKKDHLRAMNLKLKWHITSLTLYRRIPGEHWEVFKTYAFEDAAA